jgi:hypothetical protein
MDLDAFDLYFDRLGYQDLQHAVLDVASIASAKT